MTFDSPERSFTMTFEAHLCRLIGPQLHDDI